MAICIGFVHIQKERLLAVVVFKYSAYTMACVIEVQVYSLEMDTIDKLAEASSPPPLLQD